MNPHITLLLLLLAAVGCARRGKTLMVETALTDPSGLDIRGAEGEWAPGPTPAPIPLSTWIQVGDQVAYTYVDLERGPSAGWRDAAGVHVRRLHHAPAAMVVLGEEERAALALPVPPDWIDAYGPQPPPGTMWGGWRSDPRFAGRFHPDYPDDLRVVVGAIDRGQLFYEVVWVSLRRCDDVGCQGTLLNQPERVPLAMDSQVHFRFADWSEGGLPPAAAVGSLPPPEIVALAGSPRMSGMQQDDAAWSVDESVPREQRLIPMSQWVMVGDQLAFVALGPVGPVALVFGGDEVLSQSLRWRPQGMRVLSRAEREQLGLPPTPIEDPASQPPPGDWGTWRLDPRLASAMRPDDPDVIFGQLVSAPDGTGVAEIVNVRLFACDKGVCRGRLVGDPPQSRLGAGDEVSVLLDMNVGGWPIVLDLASLTPAP
jgi:hypothetical protein